MTRLDPVCYWLSLTSAALLIYSYETSIAYDRPIHTLVIALTLCAFTLLSASKAIPALLSSSKASPGYTAVPLQELDTAAKELRIEQLDDGPSQYNGRVRTSVLIIAISTLSARLEVYRRISAATECTVSSPEVLLPLLLALYDSIRFQEYRTIEISERPDHSVYDAIKVNVRKYIVRPRFRYIFPVALVCFGGFLLLGLWRPLNSTYICPVTVGQQRSIPLLQTCSLFLDLILALVAYEMIPRPDGSGLSSRRTTVLWSTTMFASALVWAIVGLILYIFKPEWRFWLMLLDVPSFFSTVFSISIQAILLCVFCISTLHSILIFGILNIALALTAVCTLLPAITFIWKFRQPFPPTSSLVLTSAFLILYLGWWSFHRIRHALGEQEHGPSRPKFLLLLAVVLLFPSWIKNSSVYFHPIDLLIYDAARSHDAYFNATQLDSSLPEVVSRYRQRYKRTPPPGFDIWWEFATNRSALILDEYDQIYDDLLPFWAVPATDLRRQTWEMVSNPWNEISGIAIRDGVAAVQENVLPTHRWMLEGVAVLVNAFARYLPDMDLAFNLNDESRVAVPFTDLKSLRHKAGGSATLGTDSWSANRKDGWIPVPEEEFHETIFRDLSFRNTFARFGSVGCPPSSAARSNPHIASQSSFCESCAAPHSIGQFLSNWTRAADICHQPDMAYLHGFYMSPAAFKTSYELRPVFSQSKPHPYNDILYPSAWNYMDKVIYAPSEQQGTPGSEDFRPAFPDPPFSQKLNTVFWRGATSEGVSSGDHTWRGMTRQRLVHMANNLTSHPHDQVTILLPERAQSGKYKYKTLPGSSLHDLGLSTDIRVVDHIARCGGIGLHDCTDQELEFAPSYVQPSDFQAHWMYKYLFDLDGAGFSGRFLPFLQSRSLPFKTALFREWYDSRITAWRHFVPQDLRLQGFWSTLAYFAGADGVMPNGKRISWAGHQKEAELIAEEGRAWSQKVLRKEDMEVYFFRLLLEWGRLTDDNREKLGYNVTKS